LARRFGRAGFLRVRAAEGASAGRTANRQFGGPSGDASMRSQSRKIAVVMSRPSFALPQSLLIFRGALQYAVESGAWQMLLDEEGFCSERKTKRRIEDLPSLGANGVVFFHEAPRIAQRIEKTKLPAVCIGVAQSPKGMPRVWVDDRAIGALGARYFVDRGFRHIGFCGPPHPVWSEPRAEGFRAAAQEAGVACEIFLSKKRDFSFNHLDTRTMWAWTSHSALRRWVRRLPKPVGVMGSHDFAALAVLEICHQEGIETPDQVAALGVNLFPLGTPAHLPALSSIDPGLQHVGYEAAALLDDMLAGRADCPQCVAVAPHTTITRASSDIRMAGDPCVDAALRFIEAQYAEPISVDDVARAAGVSRPYLGQRFRARLDRTIAEEVRRRSRGCF